MEEVQKQINELKDRISALEKKDDYDEKLYEELSIERNAIAKERGLSPAYVLTNAVLEEIALHKPMTKDELIKIKGIKEMKFQQFGENIIQVVRTYMYRSINNVVSIKL